MKEILIINGTNDEIKVYLSSYIAGEYPKYEYGDNCLEIQKGTTYKFLLNDESDRFRFIIQYHNEEHPCDDNEWDPIGKYSVAVSLGTGRNILVTPTGVIGDGVERVIKLKNIYIAINGTFINEKADFNVKEQLLKTKGATVTKNPDASIRIH